MGHVVRLRHQAPLSLASVIFSRHCKAANRMIFFHQRNANANLEDPEGREGRVNANANLEEVRVNVRQEPRYIVLDQIDYWPLPVDRTATALDRLAVGTYFALVDVAAWQRKRTVWFRNIGAVWPHI